MSNWGNMFSCKSNVTNQTKSWNKLVIPVLIKDFSVQLLHKEKGNVLFEKQLFQKAIQEYSSAINCYRFDETASSFEESPECVASAALFSNRAQCFINLQQYEQALDDSNNAISIRPDWIKGYFRRAETLSGLRKFSEALKDYQFALSKDPQNDIIECKIQKILVKIKEDNENLIIHQLLPGREICNKSIFSPVNNLIYEYATKLRNFIYLIEDVKSKQCFIIDACWDVDSILGYAKAKNLEIVGAIVTHQHFDHVGGIPPKPFDSYKIRVPGLAKLLQALPHIMAYVHPLDINEILISNPEIPRDRFSPTENNYTLTLPITNSPNAILKFIHTPGHTQGSQCILLNQTSLFTGDTLFIKSCGRVDFPESNPREMWNTLSERLKCLDNSIGVYPGHAYNGEMTTIGIEKKNGVLNFENCDDFLAIMRDA